ncbi:MAG: hypothetical protein A6F71_04970 [Cycloclasticus sp. symbiont of Poecilosclerida sp. M]|nr:MAG: hypothetical protein A6F71_04970 [Cycloclasticus sp. symbiont of Poecilosclerida sp. M]
MDIIKEVMRKDLPKHMEEECPNRDYQCEHCGKEGKYAYITLSHDKKCPKKVINCSNTDCQDAIQHHRLKRHLEGCAHTEIPCKYVKLGCQMQMKRRDMPAHEVDGNYHIIMALDSVVKLLEENVDLINKVQKLTQHPITDSSDSDDESEDKSEAEESVLSLLQRLKRTSRSL